MVCLGEYEEALKYLSELDPSFPVDKCHTALQKEAKEGIARNKRKDQEVWKGKLKSQPEVAATSSQQSRGSTDGIWMAVVVLLIAIALGVVIFFTSQAPS